MKVFGIPVCFLGGAGTLLLMKELQFAVITINHSLQVSIREKKQDALRREPCSA